VHVALLRGVNVGGHNRLPMRDLAELFRDAGCADVRTYIQSGNVVFAASATLARRVPAVVAAAIKDRFGFDSPIVIRTAAELANLLRQNPFLKAGVDPATLHVAFLRDRPDKARIGSLDPRVSPPDEFRLSGREIYLHCPNGVARSKLTAPYFDTRLKTVSTARNWRTVLTLLEMAGGPGVLR
jgi:uncharacterized protein (DUF1697 family)